jgi:hypothetical protein
MGDDPNRPRTRQEVFSEQISSSANTSTYQTKKPVADERDSSPRRFADGF